MATIKPEDRTTHVGLYGGNRTLVRVGDKVWTGLGHRVTIIAISPGGQVAFDTNSKDLANWHAPSGFTTDPTQCIEEQLGRIETRRRGIAREERYLAEEQQRLAEMQARIDQEVIREEVAS